MLAHSSLSALHLPEFQRIYLCSRPKKIWNKIPEFPLVVQYAGNGPLHMQIWRFVSWCCLQTAPGLMVLAAFFFASDSLLTMSFVLPRSRSWDLPATWDWEICKKKSLKEKEFGTQAPRMWSQDCQGPFCLKQWRAAMHSGDENVGIVFWFVCGKSCVKLSGRTSTDAHWIQCKNHVSPYFLHSLDRQTVLNCLSIMKVATFQMQRKIPEVWKEKYLNNEIARQDTAAVWKW